MRSGFLAILCSTFVFQATTALAQGSGVTVRALVEDETRLAIAGAKVTLVSSTDPAAKKEATTDVTGRVAFEALGQGDYEISARFPGFETLKVPVKAVPGMPIVRMTMRLEQLTTEVVISGGRRADDRTSASQNADTVNFDDDLLRGVPVPLESQGLMTFIATYLSTAAQGTDEVTITVDGVLVDRLTVPTSAVRRILVNKNPYSPEFRRPGKARVEIITQDGSRRHFHGNLGFSYDGSRFDARNAFRRVQPPSHQNLSDFGFNGFVPKGTFLFSLQRTTQLESALIRAYKPEGLFVAEHPRSGWQNFGVSRYDLRPNNTNRFSVRYDFVREARQGVGTSQFRLPELAQGSDTQLDEFRFAASTITSASFANEFRAYFQNEHFRSGTGVQPVGSMVIVNGAFDGGVNQKSLYGRTQAFEVQNTSTYYSGPHMIRFGGRVRPKFERVTDYSDFGGTFEFASLEAYGAGTPYLYEAVQGDPRVDFNQHEFDVFIQDEMKLRSHVSLMVGARYDWQTAVEDHNNVAPRVALSYAPTPKTVLRSGYGWFFERVPERVVQRTLFYDGVHTKRIIITNPTYPDPFVGAQATTIPPSIYRIEPGMKTPHLIQYSGSIERELWKRTLLTVEYAHLRGVNLFRATSPNSPLPGTTDRPDPNYSTILEVAANGFMRSNALAVTFRGRIGNWFKGSMFYVHSRSTNNTIGAEPGAGFPFKPPADNYNVGAETGRADFDSRHKFNTTGVLTFRGGVRIGMLLNYLSAPPFEITTGTDDNRDGFALDRPAGITRNMGIGYEFMQLDVRLAKIFRTYSPFGKRQHDFGEFELGVDALNVLNTVNLSNPVGVVTSPLFGQPNGAKAPRALQFRARYTF